MTPPLRLLFYYLWIVPHILQAVILTVLLRRGFYRRFPVFTAYTAFCLCEFVALLLVSMSPLRTWYFQWYSFGLSISAALRLGIVYEIFADVFAKHDAFHNVRKPLFRWTTVAFLIIALSFAVYTHRSDTDPNWFNVHVLERSANILLCGLVLALFLFSSYLGLSWSRRILGIAVGLGIFCSVDLALAAIESQFGYSAHVTLDLFSMAGYQCSVLIWLFCFLIPEQKTQLVTELPQTDLEAWNREVEQLLQR